MMHLRGSWLWLLSNFDSVVLGSIAGLKNSNVNLAYKFQHQNSEPPVRLFTPAFPWWCQRYPL